MRPVGSDQEFLVDLRLVSATVRDIEPDSENKLPYLRSDLFYRISGVWINVPSLRERIDDVPLLVEVFLAEYNRANNCEVVISDSALELLVRQASDMKGNLRELRQRVEGAALLASLSKGIIEPDNPQILSGRTVDLLWFVPKAIGLTDQTVVLAPPMADPSQIIVPEVAVQRVDEIPPIPDVGTVQVASSEPVPVALAPVVKTLCVDKNLLELYGANYSYPIDAQTIEILQRLIDKLGPCRLKTCTNGLTKNSLRILQESAHGALVLEVSKRFPELISSLVSERKDLILLNAFVSGGGLRSIPDSMGNITYLQGRLSYRKKQGIDIVAAANRIREKNGLASANTKDAAVPEVVTAPKTIETAAATLPASTQVPALSSGARTICTDENLKALYGNDYGYDLDLETIAKLQRAIDEIGPFKLEISSEGKIERQFEVLLLRLDLYRVVAQSLPNLIPQLITERRDKMILDAYIRNGALSSIDNSVVSKVELRSYVKTRIREKVDIFRAATRIRNKSGIQVSNLVTSKLEPATKVVTRPKIAPATVFARKEVGVSVARLTVESVEAVIRKTGPFAFLDHSNPVFPFYEALEIHFRVGPELLRSNLAAAGLNLNSILSRVQRSFIENAVRAHNSQEGVAAQLKLPIEQLPSICKRFEVPTPLKIKAVADVELDLATLELAMAKMENPFLLEITESGKITENSLKIIGDLAGHSRDEIILWAFSQIKAILPLISSAKDNAVKRESEVNGLTTVQVAAKFGISKENVEKRLARFTKVAPEFHSVIGLMVSSAALGEPILRQIRGCVSKSPFSFQTTPSGVVHDSLLAIARTEFGSEAFVTQLKKDVSAIRLIIEQEREKAVMRQSDSGADFETTCMKQENPSGNFKLR